MDRVTTGTGNVLSIFIYTYRIVPNRRPVREWEGLGGHLLISQKGDEFGLLQYRLLNRVDN